MRILVLSQYFPPEIAAGGFRVADMIPSWIDRGHTVTVVTAVPNYPTGVIPPQFRRRFMVEESRVGARVLRCWVVPGENGRLLSRVASFVSFALSSLIVALVHAGPADVVVATSPPLTVAATGRVVAILKRARFIFDVRDLWPEALSALGVLSGLPLRLSEWLETRLYRAADRVVVVSNPFISHVASRRHDGETAIRCIPNGVDLELFDRNPEESRESVRRWLGVPADATLLAYVGTFGMVHEVESVLPALARLGEENVYTAFVGDGAGRERLVELAQGLQLRNVRFPGLQPRERAAAIYAAADIGLSVVRESAAVDKVVACKIFEIMAARRPVLAVGGAEIRRVIEEAGCGTWVSPDDEEGFVQTVRQHSSIARNGSDGQAGRRYIERHSNRRVLGTDYVKMMEDLCGES